MVKRLAVRASQRNEAAIEQWMAMTWPELKRAIVEGRTLLFIDESAFYVLPGVMRTQAPMREPLLPPWRVRLM